MATTVTLKPNAIDLSGSTSGTTTLQASAVAGTTTVTLPAATDTLVGKATTDTLTNKTLTSPTMTAPVLGTPASGTVTNLTGTASININGTVGATTPAAGSFTTLSASSTSNLVATNIIGTATIGGNSATPTLYLGGTAPDADRGANIYFQSSSVQKNWRVSHDGYVADSLEFTPSTAGGGSTYTTPAVVMSPTGLAVTGALSATVNGAGKALVAAYNSNNATNDGSGVEFGKSAADPFARVWSNHNSGTLYFDTTATFPFVWRNTMTGTPVTRMTLDGSGNLAPTGLLDLSAATAGQIKFPATQNASADANTLDDYEEGTFTPVISGTSTAGTGTYTVQNGVYVKIGKMVQYQIYVILTAHTGTGDIAIGGLPFASSGYYPPAAIYINNLTLTALNYPQITVSTTSTDFLVRQVSVGGGAASAIPMDTAFDLLLSGTYQV